MKWLVLPRSFAIASCRHVKSGSFAKQRSGPLVNDQLALAAQGTTRAMGRSPRVNRQQALPQLELREDISRLTGAVIDIAMKEEGQAFGGTMV
jgi:hypothetical protein